ncbi:MAG: hypothetical protein RQM89_01885 [Acetomicrobium sp.]
MMANIKDYSSIVGQAVIDELFLLADKLKGKVIQNVNSTAVGGGVAEILSRMINLLRQLGVDARWDVIKGDEKFFNITKKMHNALHGVDVEVPLKELMYFQEVNRQNAKEMDLCGDILFIHDLSQLPWLNRKRPWAKSGCGDVTLILLLPRKKLWLF